MDHARHNLDRLRAEFATRQAAMAKAVADLQEWTRSEAERLRVAEEPVPHQQVADDEQPESWMVSGYTTPAQHSTGGGLDRLASGELSWREVFSDTTTDRDARAIRALFDERLGHVQRMRNGR
ncbi:hypothetical protein ALI144C_07065 [Actinosynnema sp. ALI-1.44]|uniref:hypothetical protein n=1 Tax=Actinosynnema sp. ALI-1.44 TaxID=1933779 RepID=UPI00097C6213|nr:hypothetical protein [Actinosynnema sp. ALI-1.44]ONI88204.1 hypothetical protein ALI144C_07065 [Actinosynnema sp. ALI-1.44]